MLVLGTPFVVYAGYEGYVTPNFPVFFVGATVFSLGTLATFSYFSTKLIGVVCSTISFGGAFIQRKDIF